MKSSNKTFLPAQAYKERNWFVIDCEGQTLGRLSTIIANILKGKTKPYYHPAIDVGDYVILINANLIKLNEKSQHYFVHNPGSPGHSLKIRNSSTCLPEVLIKKAVKGMLSNPGAKRALRRLNIYSNEQHPHRAQSPTKLTLLNL